MKYQQPDVYKQIINEVKQATRNLIQYNDNISKDEWKRAITSKLDIVEQMVTEFRYGIWREIEK